MSAKKVKIGSSVMAKNERIASENRKYFHANKILALNLISSPGSGKTTLLEAMAQHLGRKLSVIEGDLQTRRDAERVERAGCRVHQIETGGACHLNAQDVREALDELKPEENGCEILIIENVGNLVCPSSYDLGEEMKIAILSLPEGDDKVLKYPSIFTRVSVLIINKIDLLPHMEFDVERAVSECRSLNDDFTCFKISAKTGEGVREFCDFLTAKRSALTE